MTGSSSSTLFKIRISIFSVTVLLLVSVWLSSSYLSNETGYETVAEEYDVVSTPSCVDTTEHAPQVCSPPVNDTAAQLFTPYHPPFPEAGSYDYETWNQAAIARLAICTATNTCRKNEDKVIILAGRWCMVGFFENFRGGEGLWCASVIESLDRQGYTYFFTSDDDKAAHRLYQRFPDLVKVVMTESIRQNDKQYIKSESHPLGIPAWKVVNFQYYPGCGSTLGCEWTVAAELDLSEPKTNMTYLGYSMNTTTPLVPLSERPNQVWIFAKHMRYLYYENTAFPSDFFIRAKVDLMTNHKLDVEFVGGFDEEEWDHTLDKRPWTPVPPAGITNFGKLNQKEFLEKLRETRLLIGLGTPPLSPTPYDALRLGIPFLNPIRDWDRENPENKRRWSAQQQTLTRMEPPYVYHVRHGDEEELDYKNLVHVVKEALENPIESFVFDWMTEPELDKRVKYDLMERDWYGLAKEKLERRVLGLDDGELFAL